MLFPEFQSILPLSLRNSLVKCLCTARMAFRETSYRFKYHLKSQDINPLNQVNESTALKTQKERYEAASQPYDQSTSIVP